MKPKEIISDQEIETVHANANLGEMEKLHLMTQRDQPYGSVRMCCERCGEMIAYTDKRYTDDPKVYAEAEKHNFIQFWK